MEEKEKNEYLKKIKDKFPLNVVIEKLNNLKNLKVLVIGDTIIDEYVFTIPKGRASKDPILSLHFIKSELYAGGILAIANHIADFVEKIDLISILGDNNRNEEFIKNSLSKNIKTKFFTKKDSPTIKKKRYIDYIRNGKLFKLEYINDYPVDKETENEIISYLKEELPKYDIVVVGDFGHGFINENIVKVLEQYSKFLAANVQTNSANMGFNYITKYDKIDYLTTNENEVRFAFSDPYGSFSDMIKKLKKNTKFRNILFTEGKIGSRYVKNENEYLGPSLTENVIDVVGAGDAVFAITSLLSYNDIDGELLTFISNGVGALAVNIMGNKENVKKENLIKFIEKLFDKEEKEDIQNELG